MTTAIVFCDSYLLHEQAPTHPERRERLQYTWDQLVEEGLLRDPRIRLVHPYPAPHDAVREVHEGSYLEFLEHASLKGGIIDADTNVPPGLLQRALLAAGGAMAAADEVLAGNVTNAFAMVRPPGHHAGTRGGGGFCYLNNIAIMTRHIQKMGMRRVLIIDWDAHHGNGTEQIFCHDPSVLFISVHQSPLYPGTGHLSSTGTGAGKGYTVNLPVPPGSSDEVYHYLMESVIIPLARMFHPDAIAVSAGQDNHFTDPLTSLALTASGYARLMAGAVALAGELCGGRLIAVLEGGYSVEAALPYTNLGIIAAMAGMDISGIREPAAYRWMYEEASDPRALEVVRQRVGIIKEYLHPGWGDF
jgi:acetoin utilization deacetylase AcuC-like enzyme